MSEQNETLIRRWFEEVWNKKNEAAIDEMLDDDCVAYGLPDGKGGVVDNKSKAWNEFDFLNMYQQLGALSLADPSI